MSRIYDCFSECAPSSDGVHAYIYTIIPSIENGLVAITSANECLVLDRQNLTTSPILRLANVPERLSCLVSGDETGRSLVCSGGDGVVATFDVRSQAQLSQFKIDRPITALACKENNVAVGTELAHHQAVVSVWDRRLNKMLWQNSENNDDITALDFHPARDNILLSGGDDGQVNIYDLNIQEEEDSLLQGVNHGPIHRAGFLGDQRFFALSSDQNLSIHPISSPGDEEDPLPTLLGDLRPLLSCEYVIDVFRSGDEYVVATGSNISDPKIDIHELRHATTLNKTPKLKPGSQYTLQGAHGEEVVRSIFPDIVSGSIFTAGEDGCVKAFRQSDFGDAVQSSSKSSKTKRSSDVRYKPY